MKIIFMGTPDFALPCLEAVKKSGHDLIAVITQPDRPKGRGKQLAPPPVKDWAVNNGIPVYQPERIKGDYGFIDHIRSLLPDLIITAAFGQILPKEFLDIPPLGCVNVHASLLPKYRGASPIQQALIDGEKKTGISIMYMDVGMDTGDVILQEEISIDDNENAGQLHDRLSALGGDSLSRAIMMFEAALKTGSGRPAGIPQDHEKATYCKKIDKSMGDIKWDNPASVINNLIRGLTPWPGAFTYANGRRLKVWKAEEREYLAVNGRAPGTVLHADEKDGLIVACGKGALLITELQGESGRVMTSAEYLRGRPIEPGTLLGCCSE